MIAINPTIDRIDQIDHIKEKSESCTATVLRPRTRTRSERRGVKPTRSKRYAISLARKEREN